jgi:hypothetical protein
MYCLLSLLCPHQSMSGDGSQQRPLLRCSRSYRLAVVPQLTHCSNCPAYNISTLTAQKSPFLIAVVQSLRCKHICLRSRYSLTAVVYFLVSRSLPNNRCSYHNMYFYYISCVLHVLYLILPDLTILTICEEHKSWSPFEIFSILVSLGPTKKTSMAFSPQANYTDRATAACRRS